jgi:hypothetical protein
MTGASCASSRGGVVQWWYPRRSLFPSCLVQIYNHWMKAERIEVSCGGRSPATALRARQPAADHMGRHYDRTAQR